MSSSDASPPQLASTLAAPSAVAVSAERKAKSARKPPSAGEAQAWARRVHDVQFSRLSEPERERLQQRVAQAKSMSVQMKKCKAVEARTYHAKAHSMQSMRESMTWGAEEQASRAQQRVAAMERDDRSLQMSSEAAPVSASTAVVVSRADNARRARRPAPPSGDDDEAPMPPSPLDDMFAGVVAEPAPAMSARDEAATIASLQAEPKNDAECAAKFSLYDAFSQKVSGIRDDLDGLVAEACPQLPELPKAAVQKDMKSLDSARNIGIADDARCWFVCAMYRQAVANCDKMRGISESITRKLKLVSDEIQTECPICLEPWSKKDDAEARDGDDDDEEEGVVPVTLGCCHQVCTTCWDNWAALNGGGEAFCPLCRHREFVDILAARSDAA